MALKLFNPETAPVLNRNQPAISLYPKTGQIAFNKTLSAQLSLTEHDKLEFGQDEENPSKWFVTKDEKGYRLQSVKDGGGVRFANITLVKAILSTSKKTDDKPVHIEVMEKQIKLAGKTWWQLDLSKLKK